MKVFVLLILIILLQIGIYSQNNIELLIFNADVRTVDPRRPRAGAIAISGGKILAVGTSRQIRKLAGPQTRLIDAKGKLVLPGFNDSHVHFMGIGNQFSSIDLRRVSTPKQAIDKIAYYSKVLPTGRWILGGQWNHQNWTPNNLPTKSLIDEVTPDNPVFLYNNDAKMAWVNSLALKKAGIDKDTADPPGGLIVRDNEGEPTGILHKTAIKLITEVAPRYQTKNLPEVAETASNYAASLGVTSVQDVHSDYLESTLRQLNRDGKLKTRIYDCVPLLDWKRLANRRAKRAEGDPMIRTGCLKYFSDGSLDAIPILTDDIAGADKAGLQVMFHAIGARANAAVLTMYEGVLRRNGRKDRRFRIEHAHNIRKTDWRRLRRSGTIASMQPHLFYGGEPYRSLLLQRTSIAFGSDASITDLNPLLGIYAAVNRGTASETLTVKQAVRLYTMGSAYAEFQEKIKGSISVGKLADLVILSKNIFLIDKREIRESKVVTTILGGKIVYSSEKF